MYMVDDRLNEIRATIDRLAVEYNELSMLQMHGVKQVDENNQPVPLADNIITFPIHRRVQ